MKFSTLEMTFRNSTDLEKYVNAFNTDYKSYGEKTSPTTLVFSSVPEEKIIRFIKAKNRAYRKAFGTTFNPVTSLYTLN